MDFCRFSIGTCCRPIYSNHNWGKASYGLYVKITHGCMGGGGGEKAESILRFRPVLAGLAPGQKMGAMQNQAWVSKQIAQPEWFI
jgi:hypothetical protein